MRIILLFIQFLGLFSLCGQDKWVNYTKSDGLASNLVNDVLIENQSKIWVATDSGISLIFGQSIQTYNSSNSNLNSDRVKNLMFFNGSVYLRTDSGLSYFDGRRFTNYTTSNGLLSIDIKGMDTDRLGNMWLASPQGVTRFDGVQFFHDTGRFAQSIAVDTNNNVYIQKYTAIFNLPFGPPSCEIFDGNSWFVPTPNFNYAISSSKFKRTRSGSLIIVGRSDDFYAEVTYPLNLSQKFVYDDNGNPIDDFHEVEIDKQLNEWIGRSSLLPVNFYKGQGSNFKGFVFDQVSTDIVAIDAKDGFIVCGTNRGIFINSNTISPSSPSIGIDTNKINTSINIYGPLFNDILTSSSHFEYPKGSGIQAIFNARLIVAAKQTTDTSFYVHPIDPNANSMEPGPIGGSAYHSNYLFKFTSQEIANHIANYGRPGYTLDNKISSWPAIGDTTRGEPFDLLPFVDVNNNQCYDPINGDYPAIMGDEAIYWINHPDNNPKSLEFQGMLYAYSSPNLALDQSVYLRYTVINRSNTLIDSIKLGLFINGDLGNPGDDYVGCDTINNIVYFYNGDSFDDSYANPFANINGYGTNIPTLGIKFISDSLDSHVSIGSGNAVNGTPTSSSDWFNLLNAKWHDGTTIKYGGDGLSSSGTSNAVTKFMYTGDPFFRSGWSELFPGGTQGSHLPGERKSVSSIPYFSLLPGEHKTIDMVIGFGNSGSTLIGGTISSMTSYLNTAATHFANQSLANVTYAKFANCTVTSLTEDNKDHNAIAIYPNPNQGTFKLFSATKMEQVQIFNLKGQVVFDQSREGLYETNVELDSKLENGLYFLRIRNVKGIWKTKKLVIN